MSLDVVPPKAPHKDYLGRFREIVSDPLNLLIDRVPFAGYVEDGNVILHNGNRVAASGELAYYQEFSRILIINRGVHEPLEEFVFQEVLRVMPDAPVMIELGAYWAHYSMWMKRVRPDATTIMVEPDPKSLAAGQANFALNGYEGEFIPAFVGTGQWELDPFLRERRIRHVDVLHVDIQGYEIELLQSGTRALASGFIDYVFVSTHSQDLHHAVINGFAKLDFRVEAQSDFESGTTSSDGFVFAARSGAVPVFEGFEPPRRVDIARWPADSVAEAVNAARAAAVRR